jgi:hypothetical protein
MVNFIIKPGNINKKLIMPLAYIIVYIGMNFFYEYFEYDGVALYLEHFGYGIGEMMTYFMVYSFKYQSKSEQNKKNISLSKIIKDYFYLFLISCFYMLDYILPYYILPEEESDKEFIDVEGIFITDAFEIIFITLGTNIFLKYKYYIHHIISIGILLILCVFMDILAGNFQELGIYNIINMITYILSDAMLYTYLKYLIDSKYYYFMDVLFFNGLTDSLAHILSIGALYLIHSKNGTNKVTLDFFNYYNENGISYMIIWFFFGFVFTGIIVGYLEFVILTELTPNYVIYGYCLAKIPTAILSNYERIPIWLIIIVSIIQIFFSLFYLEILEFNFCSLNANTKKNIKIREIEQSYNIKADDEFSYEDSEISVEGYDLIDMYKIKKNKKKKSVELENKKEDNSINS